MIISNVIIAVAGCIFGLTFYFMFVRSFVGYIEGRSI